jgi:hypothetical protein
MPRAARLLAKTYAETVLPQATRAGFAPEEQRVDPDSDWVSAVIPDFFQRADDFK